MTCVVVLVNLLRAMSICVGSQASISFDRGDMAPHNALGDLLVNRAERLLSRPLASSLQL